MTNVLKEILEFFVSCGSDVISVPKDKDNLDCIFQNRLIRDWESAVLIQ